MKRLIYFIVITLFICSCDKNDKDTSGSIYGIVSDKSTNELVAGVNVSLAPGGKSTVTGTDGSYNFLDLESGVYTILITKESYNPEKKEIAVADGKRMEGHFQIERIPAILTIDKEALDFGENTDLNTLSFSIVNRGYQTLKWSIEQNCSWVKEIKPANGTLEHSITETVTVVIDRDKLSGGNNETVIIVKSSNGSSEITLKATGTLPALNVLPVINIQSYTAVFNGEITAPGLPSYTERGFVYSTSPTPTIENTVAKLTAPVTEDTKYSVNVSELVREQTYYVRAYAINKTGTVYSTNEEIFKTVLTVDYITLQADGIMIQKYDISSGLDWSSAKDICSPSRMGGYSDWRLPTQGELLAVYDSKDIVGNFNTSQEKSRYWTSTTSSDGGYMHVNFYNGNYHIGYDTDSYRVRCVRSLP